MLTTIFILIVFFLFDYEPDDDGSGSKSFFPVYSGNYVGCFGGSNSVGRVSGIVLFS